MARAKRIRRILLAHREPSGDQRFPAQVLWFAKEQNARINLVHVVSTVPTPGRRSSLGSAADLHSSLVGERKHGLERLANKAREKGLHVTASVRVGMPHVELIRAASALKADVVAVVEQGRIGRLGFSGTTLRLLRECPTPVWAVRSPLKRNRRRIMAAVDLGPRGHDSNRPNRRILEVATSFARAEGTTLYVFHAWSLRGEQLPRTRRAAETERLLVNTRAAQRKRLESLVRSPLLRGIHVEARLEKGLPRTLVPEVVHQLKIEVLVMGTLSRVGGPGVVIGNTSEHILDKLDCSVIAVKPKDFVGPVALE